MGQYKKVATLDEAKEVYRTDLDAAIRELSEKLNTMGWELSHAISELQGLASRAVIVEGKEFDYYRGSVENQIVGVALKQVRAIASALHQGGSDFDATRYAISEALTPDE